MKFATLCAVLFINLTEFVKADNTCKVPNGNAGTCIKINNCPPLRFLYKKKHKTSDENLFIRQSMCGYRNSNPVKVCCPSESEWIFFQPVPVVVPPSPVYRQPKPIPTPTLIQPNLLTIKNFNTTDRTIELRIKPTTDDEDYSSFCGIDTSSGNRITNGLATAVDQYPWLVLLEYAKSFLGCGGSLITSRYVLTAAHCLRSLRNGRPLFVRLGEYNTTTFPTDVVEVDGGGTEEVTVTVIEIRASYVYPNYVRELRVHDIGLVEMKEAVDFDDFIKVICLPGRNYTEYFNSSTFFYVAGWGSDNITSGTEVKMDTIVSYKQHSQCPLVRETWQSSQICAGGEGGRDSCTGDSGGPLMYETDDHRYDAVGIVSYGSKVCGVEGEPAVYTYVFTYVPWINSILRGSMDYL